MEGERRIGNPKQDSSILIRLLDRLGKRGTVVGCLGGGYIFYIFFTPRVRHKNIHTDFVYLYI